MPNLNGPLTVKQLRELGYTMIVIGVTGNVLPEDRNYFIQQGANAVLPKPLSLPILLELYDKLYQERNL